MMAKVRLRFISSFKVAKAKFLECLKSIWGTKLLKKSQMALKRGKKRQSEVMPKSIRRFCRLSLQVQN